MDNSFLYSHIWQLVVAFLLGGVIGVERDIHGRAAGMRTNMLVCAGAALFTMASLNVNGSDPGRIAAQVVSGIGFLGAGTILKAGFTVRGLTTAACMWLVAAVGIMCGLGQLLMATVATFGTLAVLLLAKRLEGRLHRLYSLRLTVYSPRGDFRTAVIDKIRQERNEFSLIVMSVNYDPTTGMYRYEFDIDTHTRLEQPEISEQLIQCVTQLAPDTKDIRVSCIS